MNLSCPELALHLLADLLWLRHVALSSPFPVLLLPPLLRGERTTTGGSQLQACCQSPLRCAIPWQGPSGPAVPGWSLPPPWLRLPMKGHPSQCWDPSGSPHQGPEQQHCSALGSLAELQDFAVLSSHHCPKQLLHLSPDASFQRQML